MESKPSMRRLRVVFATSLGAALLIGSLPGAQLVSAATSMCTPSGTIAAGDYMIQANEWNSSLQQCITYTGGTAWSVTTANFNTATNGAPATYPSIFKGCHWGLCTSNSGLPIQTSKLTSATTSWSTTQTGSGMYNVAYDLWFNSAPTTGGQPDGTELMIWQNRLNAWPFGSQTATASIGGSNWQVWTGQQSSWKVITYVLDPGTTAFSNLDVLALIKDAVNRGSVNSAHYLIDAEAGFEIWIGGQGLGVNSFSFNASAGGSSATATPTVTASATPKATASATPKATPTATASATPKATPTATASPTRTASSSPTGTATPTGASGGSAKCSVTYTIGSSWGSGFVANVTVNNTGSVATKTWKVAWTWPGNQAISNAWSATVSSSGTAVTASNAAFNGSIAGGGNTSLGFQASYSGTNANPTLTCSAT